MGETEEQANLGFARLDTEREQRLGLPEVVYGPGKSVDQTSSIVRRLLVANHGPVLVTRIDAEPATKVLAVVPGGRYDPEARLLVWRAAESRGFRVAVVTAGTADHPVAHEAAAVASAIGLDVELSEDVGVAGIHRVLAIADCLSVCNVVIVIAGMEGALASVVGGLVACPVIAVPTSTGYGAALEGVTALLAMMTSCASGLVVVNIDSGFGAAIAAHRMAFARTRTTE